MRLSNLHERRMGSIHLHLSNLFIFCASLRNCDVNFLTGFTLSYFFKLSLTLERLTFKSFASWCVLSFESRANRLRTFSMFPRPVAMLAPTTTVAFLMLPCIFWWWNKRIPFKFCSSSHCIFWSLPIAICYGQYVWSKNRKGNWCPPEILKLNGFSRNRVNVGVSYLESISQWEMGLKSE